MAALSIFTWVRWERRLPSDDTARQQFYAHRNDYLNLALLLQRDSEIRFIDSDGDATTNGVPRSIPEYRLLMRELGVKAVSVGADGSLHFTLWGMGCAICSDRYEGLLYFPKGATGGPGAVWNPVVVKSLADRDLPLTGGSVADGLYIVPLEPKWYIFRFEYRE